jgi:hypothetical protein
LLAQCGMEAEADGESPVSSPDRRAVLIAGGTITVPAVEETTDGATDSAKVVFFTEAVGLGALSHL